ncbi:MAG: hypothetical protein ACRENP_19265 [Longimicrobiales bacterium]
MTARRRDPRHDATYEGLYARHARSHLVGPSRVVLRTDAEIRSSINVRDVLLWFLPARRPSAGLGCMAVYWNGMLVHGPASAEFWLGLSTTDLEGVEYYRNLIDAAFVFRDLPGYLEGRTRCSVVV